MSALPDYTSRRQRIRFNLSEKIPLAGPLTVYIEPTNICNFKCIYCPESFSDYKEKAGGLFKLSSIDFQSIAQQIASLNTVKIIHFYMMGEPFANKNLLEYVSASKTRHLSETLVVTSNGSLITAEIYKQICTSGLDYLRISIYGHDEVSHATTTKSPISLARIKANLMGLKKFRDENQYSSPHIYIKMIESKVESENHAFLEYFKDVGDEIGLEEVMNWNDPDEGNLSQVVTSEMLSSKSFKNKKSVCTLPFLSLVIHSDLKVSVCCVDWNKQAIVGDLRKHTLPEIWNGEELRAFQLKHLQGRRSELEGCKNCTFLHTQPDNIDNVSEAEFLSRLS